MVLTLKKRALKKNGNPVFLSQININQMTCSCVLRHGFYSYMETAPARAAGAGRRGTLAPKQQLFQGKNINYVI